MKRAAQHVIVLPGAREIARKAGSTMLIASLLPAAVFYLTLSLSTLRVAVAVTLAWYYAGLLWTHARGKPLLAAAMLGAGLLTLRAVLAFWTNSSFLYFLQPVAGTVATATAFSVTALAGRPLLDRLVHDFCPLPEALSNGCAPITTSATCRWCGRWPTSSMRAGRCGCCPRRPSADSWCCAPCCHRCW